MTEHPELRKGRHRLFIPIKDNSAGKKLSATAISRWICTNNSGFSHRPSEQQEYRTIPGKVKPHEVRAVAT